MVCVDASDTATHSVGRLPSVVGPVQISITSTGESSRDPYIKS